MKIVRAAKIVKNKDQRSKYKNKQKNKNGINKSQGHLRRR
jgi:hypothetical protein